MYLIPSSIIVGTKNETEGDSMDKRATIGTRLKELRNCKEKSCQGVVLDMKRRGLVISRELLDKWERDLRIPNGEAIVKLAEYYGTTTDYLLGYDDAKLSVDRLQITQDTLGLSLRATENLIKISSNRGGREADILSAILESPHLPELLSEMVDSQNGIIRVMNYLRPKEEQDASSVLRPMRISFVNNGLDLADMYVLRVTRQIESFLRDILGYNELEKEAQHGEYTED